MQQPPGVGSSMSSGVISDHKVNRSLLFSLNLEFVAPRFFFLSFLQSRNYRVCSGDFVQHYQVALFKIYFYSNLFGETISRSEMIGSIRRICSTLSNLFCPRDFHLFPSFLGYNFSPYLPDLLLLALFSLVRNTQKFSNQKKETPINMPTTSLVRDCREVG